MDKKSTDAQIRAAKKYHEKTYKRIPLDIKIAAAAELKAFCENNGYKVNTYIKSAIADKYKRDTGLDIDL